MRINNKGQVLVSFVLILPFMIVLFSILIDILVLTSDKKRLEDIIDNVCSIKNTTDEKIEKILLANDEKIKNIKIIRDNEEILKISFEKEEPVLFFKIIKKSNNLKIEKECKRGNNHER